MICGRQQRLARATRHRAIRDLIRPTVRTHNSTLSDAEENRLVRTLIAIYRPGMDMHTFATRVRSHLDTVPRHGE